MTTQRASFSYQEIIDLHTESDTVSVLGIHTPTGDTPRRMAPGFFKQFRKYKYEGCSIALVPAATLPADPLQVSYEAGEPTIDPRDMLNPIMFHGCHGNDLGDILNRLYAANTVSENDFSKHLGSDSLDMLTYPNDAVQGFDLDSDLLESLYYRALTDKSWQKAHVQRGFRKNGLHPRVYALASTRQISGTSSLADLGVVPGPFEAEIDPRTGTYRMVSPAVNGNRFLTPRTVRLGWLDTLNVLGASAESVDWSTAQGMIDGADDFMKGAIKNNENWNELERLYMGVILLPPAYKQEMYFRLAINHFFSFAGFRSVSLSNFELEAPGYQNWNDRITAEESDPPTPDPDPDPTPDPPTPPTPTRHGVNVVLNGEGLTSSITATFSYGPVGQGFQTKSIDVYDGVTTEEFIELPDGFDWRWIVSTATAGVTFSPVQGTFTDPSDETEVYIVVRS